MSKPLIFISYSREDQDKANLLASLLQKTNFEFWIDNKALMAGDDFAEEIRSAIRRATYFIVLISNNSLKDGSYVGKELQFALALAGGAIWSERYIIPLRLDDVPLDKSDLNAYHVVDLPTIDEESVARLVKFLGNNIPQINVRNSGYLHAVGVILGLMVWVFVLAIIHVAQNPAQEDWRNTGVVLKLWEICQQLAVRWWHVISLTDEDGYVFPVGLLFVYLLFRWAKWPVRLFRHKKYQFTPLSFTAAVSISTVLTFGCIYLFMKLT